VRARAAILAAGLAVGCALAWPVAAAAFGFEPGGADFSASATNQSGTPTTQAGAHPHLFETAVHLNTAGGVSDGDLRDLELRLPPGLLINPTAIAECSAASFATPRNSPFEASESGESCPNSSQVGTVAVAVGGTVRHFGLFNLAPSFGTVAAIGASPFGTPLVFEVHLREPDSLELDLRELPQSFDLQDLELTVWGTPWRLADDTSGGYHDAQRGNCLKEADGGTWAPTPEERKAAKCLVFGSVAAPESLVKSYLTMPTAPCGTPLAFTAHAISWQGQSANATTTAPAVAKCNRALSIPRVQLMTDAAASRTGLAFNLAVNDGGGITNPAGIARPAIKTAILSLPEGLTINPSLGAGLGVCDEAEFARETAGSEPGAGCPNASKIGTVTVGGALGIAEPLQGSVYLARPHANPFGTLVAVYLLARSPRRGLIVKSHGKLEPDLRTGSLHATFEDLPRLLYTHFSLTLREGQRSTLVSPPTCGVHTAALDLSSWAEPAVFKRETSAFAIVSGEGGGPCPHGGIPPFAPGLLAGSLNPTPAAYTPFYLRMTRTDAEQEITSYSASFPKGLLAKVAGVGECSDAAIEAAKHRSGAAELGNPSCPESSKIGRTMAGYGVGGVLAWAPGNLYLAGPYHASELSVVAIDAATIGPFDLGVVVVRTAVRVDARRGQVSIDAAGSDPIPHILAGIPVHVRDIRVYIDRPGFTRNGTSCDPTSVASTLTGAGANPFSSGDETAATSTQRFQLLGCGALRFAPRLSLRLKGGTRRARHPALRVGLTARDGDANIAAASLRLPPGLFLAQEHLRSICSRAQFARDACPADSIYGRARALTPLLEAPLEGPVYVRSSSGKVPDLVMALRGRGVTVEVVCRIDSSRGGLRGSCDSLPDAPVTSFTMILPGGKRSLLVNSEDLCAAPQRANARFMAQNNATAILHPKLRVDCAKRGGKGRRKRPRRGGRPPKAKGSTLEARSSELAQQGNLRLDFNARVRPKALPREGTAPISIDVGGKIATTDGSTPPQLRAMEIAINRAGRLDTKGLSICHLADIQPATTANALAACGDAKVGEGDFSANVVIPEQSPFPSDGKLIAFNGEQGGRRVIFAHVYGTEPIPTSFTLPLRISRAKGRFGTVLSAKLPQVTSSVAFVTGISLRLHRTFYYRGERHSYLAAGCPAPQGFPGAVYPLARATFSFAGAVALSTTATRDCRVARSGS
jgi:hypothetical protein